MKTAPKWMKLALMATLVLSLVALVGCGGGAEPGEKPAETPATPAPEAPAAADYALIQDGKLLVGSDCDYPPYIQLTPAGDPEGFEYDLMVAVGKKMGLEVEYIAPQSFDTLIAQAAAGGKMDVAVSSFTITPERSEQIDFSDSYFEEGVDQAITVPADSAIASRADLAGKKVAAQSGTTGADWVKENLSGSTLVPLTNITDAFAAMSAGSVDAAVNDLPTAERLIKDSFPGMKILESIATAEQYGIVVSKDNPGLTEALNGALAAVKADGEYDAIYKKWFE